MGSKVRLRYASILLYAFNILGAILAFIFATTVTRRLSIDDYSAYIVLMRYVTLFAIPSTIYTYWVTRSVSRDNNTSTTGIVSSIVLGALAVPVYIVLVQLLSTEINQPMSALLLTAVILFIEYMSSSLTSISSGYAPEINGYGSVGLKAIQAISGYILVGVMMTGLTGAIIAVLLGKIGLLLIELVMNARLIRASKFEIGILKKWIGVSWLPLFSALPAILLSMDVALVRYFFDNGTPIAYYGVAMSIVQTILFSNVVTYSLLPKILAKRNLEDLRESIWLLLLLSIPFLFLILFYAEPIVAIFGTQYFMIGGILRLFILSSFMATIANLITVAYFGLDRADETILSSRVLLKSKIFKATAFNVAFYSIYLIILTSVSTLNYSAFALSEVWALFAMFPSLGMIAIIGYYLKKDYHESFPFLYLLKSIIRFSIPAILMLIPLYALPISIVSGFYNMISNMFVPLVASLFLYFFLLYAIDPKFRTLMKDLLRKMNLYHPKA